MTTARPFSLVPTGSSARGASGQQVLEARLLALTTDGIRLLYDRRIPPGRGKIKHIAIAPSGVWVIDTRRHSTRPRLRLTAMHRRLDAVRQIVGAGVPVTGIVCFVDADLPRTGGSFTASDVVIAGPNKARDLIRSGRGLTESQIDSIHRQLGAALPRA